MNWLREPDAEPIPGYQLVEPIGTGGFGEVWRCVAPGGIQKAIKFVYGNLNSLEGDDVRAQQEMKALERIKDVRHPFVLSIEQIRDVGGELCIVMELADKNLHDTLVEYQQMGRPGIPRDILLGFLDDAAVGLDHLIEKHNLQHLDVKPRNLFVVADRVKVADFGLVKQLERSSSSGLMGGVTPIYAAPETFSNKISKHSDQYSLAIVYIELLTGLRPFSGKNIRQLALQHMTEPPDLTMLPEVDRVILARALAKNPDERFPSCTAFIRSLAGGPRSSDSSGSGSGGMYEPTTWAKANRVAGEVDLTPAGNFDLGWKPSRGGAAVAEPEHEDLGVTAVQKEVGILRPTVLIGVGSFGRRALQEVRCRLIDRLGDMSLVPAFRFLYVDCDPDAVNKATSAPPDVALSPDDVFPLPLQQVTGYRRRQLEQILDWLPREKLYSIPRSLNAGGSRALGRLAFCDNYLRFVTRLRRELQIATHPESISQSSDQTGLMPRDNVPQVYVFSGATGGAGGMLVDLGYAVRRVLDRMNAEDSPVTAFLYAASPTDPGTPDHELANVFATLTEMNHYAEEDVNFVAQYGGPEGPRVEGKGLPFSATYLMPMADRTPAAFRDCVAHLAGYVAHDLTTPLGPALEQVRQQGSGYGRSPFRGFGTYGVWFPRGLLLRAAAQKICIELIRKWQKDTNTANSPTLERLATQVQGDARLKPDAVQKYIEREMPRGPEGAPADQIERWLHGLEGQIEAMARRSDAGAWSRNVWDQAREFIGVRPTNEQDITVRRGRLSKALDEGIRRTAQMWGNEFAAIAGPLQDEPGHRLAAVEAALRRFSIVCGSLAETVDKQLRQLAVKTQSSRSDVQSALDACQAGSGTFSFFGGRSNRSMRHFLEQLRAFARLRLQEDFLDATARCYRAIQGEIETQTRDLAYCRNRLASVLQVLDSPLANLPAHPDSPIGLSEESLQQTLHPTNTVQVVLPSGEKHIDRSVRRVLNSVNDAEKLRLETALQKLVLESRGGLAGLCRINADLFRTLVAPMIEQTTAFLGELLPVTDVTEVETSSARAVEEDLSARITDYHERAHPPCDSTAEVRTFVIVPDSDSGRSFASDVRRTLPSALTIPVQGSTTDLLFCREQGCLEPSELMSLLSACLPAYYQSLASPHTNPHARFDVTEWMPIGE
ncbi:MAG: tubulin-like doman-containing protein [Gemmataceae bacterium]